MTNENEKEDEKSKAIKLNRIDRWKVGTFKPNVVKLENCIEFAPLVEFSEELGCGLYGCTYSYPRELGFEIRRRFGNNQQDVVAKIIDRNEYAEEEILLARRMAFEGIGPKIIDVLRCESHIAIIMERLDVTLLQYQNWLNQYREFLKSNGGSEDEITKENRYLITNTIEQLIQRLQQLGISHNDLHSQNVMLKFSKANDMASPIEKVLFIDWGRANIDTDLLRHFEMLSASIKSSGYYVVNPQISKISSSQNLQVVKFILFSLESWYKQVVKEEQNEIQDIVKYLEAIPYEKLDHKQRKLFQLISVWQQWAKIREAQMESIDALMWVNSMRILGRLPKWISLLTKTNSNALQVPIQETIEIQK